MTDGWSRVFHEQVATLVPRKRNQTVCMGLTRLFWVGRCPSHQSLLNSC